MTTRLRPRRWWVVLAALSASIAHAQDPPTDEARGVASEPLPPPGPSRPLSESAARIVRNLEDEAQPRCGRISEGVPCFPVSTVKSRPQWATSLRQSLGVLGPDESPSPSRPPTLAELQPYRPGPIGMVMTLGSFDPGCVGKSLLKTLEGKNDTYYLYRVRDVRGERVALHDHRLDPATFQGSVELLGRFRGECHALAAYRHEDRRAASVAP